MTFDLLVPARKFRRNPGACKLTDAVTLASAHPADALPLGQLREDLRAAGARPNTLQGAASAQIMILRNRAIGGPEGYRLTVTPKSIEIVSATDAGAYYGIQTLRDLLHLHGTRLPCLRIDDAPVFQRRGVYHDCSRGKVPTVDTLKDLIEFLAHWKVNELQLYIENVFTFRKHPDIGKGFSPFTPDELLAVQAHCKRHHVRFVPSLASFGHMEKTLMLPRYSRLGEMPGYGDLPGGTTLCPGDPGSIRLVEDLYSEFVPLFEAEDFNVCGDEPWELGKGRSKRRAAARGTGPVYLEFMLKLRELCLKHGKRMNMWGDIVLKHPEIIPRIPRDIVMLNWDYYPEGRRIARTREFTRAGLPLICCPGTNGWQSHGTRLQTALNNVSVFAGVARQNGAEGLLNTDWGDCGHRNTLGVSLCSFAHGAAHAWNTAAVDDGGFVRNFAFHVFGDRTGELARSLQALGAEESGGWVYHAVMESLRKPELLSRGFARGPVAFDAQKWDDQQIQDRLLALRALAWPEPDDRMMPFVALAVCEFALATRMELLGWQRLALARQVRSGKTPRRRVLLAHAEGMRSTGDWFDLLWSFRNKRSRLADNMAGFRRVAREAEMLGR